MYQPELESMPRDQLEALQLQRLQATLKRVYENVPLYRAKLDDAGLDPSSVTSLDAVPQIPFTVKDDLRSAYPYGMFAVPLHDIVSGVEPQSCPCPRPSHSLWTLGTYVAGQPSWASRTLIAFRPRQACSANGCQ